MPSVTRLLLDREHRPCADRPAPSGRPAQGCLAWGHRAHARAGASATDVSASARPRGAERGGRETATDRAAALATDTPRRGGTHDGGLASTAVVTAAPGRGADRDPDRSGTGALAALVDLLHGAYLASPDTLPEVVARAARALGVRTEVYLVDYASTELVPFLADPGSHRKTFSLDGTLPGRAFRLGPAQLSTVDGQSRLWVPILNGIEAARQIRETLVKRTSTMFEAAASGKAWWHRAYLQNHLWVNVSGMAVAALTRNAQSLEALHSRPLSPAAWPAEAAGLLREHREWLRVEWREFMQRLHHC